MLATVMEMATISHSRRSHAGYSDGDGNHQPLEEVYINLAASSQTYAHRPSYSTDLIGLELVTTVLPAFRTDREQKQLYQARKMILAFRP